MAALDLNLYFEGMIIAEPTFQVLGEFLQPGTTLTEKSAAQKVLAILPDNSPNSDEVWSFGRTCMEVAEQIPYHHQSQLKLVGLLERLGWSTKLGNVDHGEVCGRPRKNRACLKLKIYRTQIPATTTDMYASEKLLGTLSIVCAPSVYPLYIQHLSSYVLRSR